MAHGSRRTLIRTVQRGCSPAFAGCRAGAQQGGNVRGMNGEGIPSEFVSVKSLAIAGFTARAALQGWDPDQAGRCRAAPRSQEQSP